MQTKLPISIDLCDGFLNPEIRCGYRVSARQKKIWAVELDLLKVFLDVCKLNGIKVQVFAGTLLGTVRHKGFIPWDDDVDVCMDRDNYNKLLSLPPTAFPEPYFLQTTYSDRKFFFAYARLRNSKTTAIIKNQGIVEYNNGIYIDIFVLDGLVGNIFFRKAQFCIKYILERFIEDYWLVGVNEKRFPQIVSFLLKPFYRLIGYDRLRALHTGVLSVFTKVSDRLSFITHIESLATKYVVLKAEMDATIEMPFENIMVPCTSMYDSVLKRIYGNYMEYPPLEDRGEWHNGIITFDPDIPYKEFIERTKCK